MSGINRKRVVELAKQSRSGGAQRASVPERELLCMPLRKQFLWAAVVIEQVSTLEEMAAYWPLVAKILSKHMSHHRHRRETEQVDMQTIQRLGPKLHRLFVESTRETREKIEVRGMMAFLLEVQEHLHTEDQLTSNGDSS
jgi:hypothetical protein